MCGIGVKFTQAGKSYIYVLFEGTFSTENVLVFFMKLAPCFVPWAMFNLVF